MGKKRTNDANAVEKLVEESTPTKKVKKSENLTSNDPVKETVEPKKTRGRPKKPVETEKSEVDQKIEEKPVEDIKEDRRVRSKKPIETKPIKQKVSRKKKVDQEIEQQESEKEENESDKEEEDKEEKESEKEEQEDDRIPVFDSDEESEKESKQPELINKSNTSLKKFDFEEFAGTKETTDSCSEEENKETLEVAKEVETQPKKSRSKKASVKTIEQPQTSNSPTKPAARTTRNTSNAKKIDQQVKSSPKATKTRKVSTAKKAKVTEKAEEEENNSDEQPVESVKEKKPARQTRKTKNNQLEQDKSSVVDSSKTTKAKAKATKGKKSKLTEKPIEEEKEDLSDKEESEDSKEDNKISTEPKPTTSSTLDAKKMSKKSDKNPFKIISLNCAGVRAAVSKGLVEFLNDEDPDIVCLQETKCPEDKMPEELKELGYYIYWSSSESKPNQSGVATLCKVEPINVTYGIQSEIHDTEGRAITCEYENFYLVNIYATNASRNLTNLDKKRDWNERFKNYMVDLDKIKPVIACGDFNCAHKEIDLKNPKANQKNAGFTPEEREDFSDLLENGFFDSFRQLYPDKKDAYTFWSNLRSSRANNVGWRLDYYILSDRLQDALVDNIINDDQYFSDHCPITLLIHV